MIEDKYIGYTPVPNCCSKNEIYSGKWVLCKKHGWKHINTPGKQLELQIK